MGLVVPLLFPGIALHRGRHQSSLALMAPIRPLGTTGPAYALLQAGLDRPSPP
ncbi:MAG: hypothetical protein ACRD1D_13180 [Acidimicrobiales bacterium]